MQLGLPQQVLVDAVIPRFGDDSRINNLVRDAVLVVGFAALVSLSAQIAIKIPATVVPITGQTFGVLLTGAALGSKRGALSMLLYMLVGMFWLDVFAPSPAPLSEQEILHFILPWSGKGGLVWSMASGGYIVGFVFASYLIGLLAERGWHNRSNVLFAMLGGNALIYIIGLPWLGVHIANNEGLYTYFQSQGGTNVLDMTLRGGLYPFIGGDAIKLLGAVLLLPGTWWAVNTVKRPKHED